MDLPVTDMPVIKTRLMGPEHRGGLRLDAHVYRHEEPRRESRRDPPEDSNPPLDRSSDGSS